MPLAEPRNTYSLRSMPRRKPKYRVSAIPSPGNGGRHNSLRRRVDGCCAPRTTNPSDFCYCPISRAAPRNRSPADIPILPSPMPNVRSSKKRSALAVPSPEIPTLRAVLFEDTAAGSFGAATATVATAKAADCPTESASRQVRWPPFAILCPTVQPSGRSPLKTEHSCSACNKTAVAADSRSEDG